ncbi:hypothetical protein MYXA107069_34615 [Myxococcus xanthus]
MPCMLPPSISEAPAAPRYSCVAMVTSPGNSMPPAPPDSGACTTRKCVYGSGPRRRSNSASIDVAYFNTRSPAAWSAAA